KRPSTGTSQTSEPDRLEEITLGRPKDVAESANCREMITADDLHTITGMRIKAATPNEPTKVCVFELYAADEYYGSIGVSFESAPDDYFVDYEQINLTANSAFEQELHSDDCHL